MEEVTTRRERDVVAEVERFLVVQITTEQGKLPTVTQRCQSHTAVDLVETVLEKAWVEIVGCVELIRINHVCGNR